MATSKTLTPTNQTISIPAMSDSPDMSVPADAISKEADAINALNRKQTTILSASNITSDSVLYGMGAGDYQVSGTKSDYLPFRYGTISIFKSAGSSSYGYVLGTDTANGATYIRHFNSSGWQETWQELALNSNVTALRGRFYIEIAANTDLNNLSTPGFYSCATGAIAQSLVHCPATSNFTMFVMGKGSYNNQLIIWGGDLYARSGGSYGYTHWYKHEGVDVGY